MSQAVPDIACPVCGTELTLAQLFSHEETQRAFSRLASVSVPLGARVLRYCALFAPPKTRLTVAKQVKLILALLPDLERGAIDHKGREWAVPLSIWAQAIDQMLASRDVGRLELPMKGHAYLYSILVGLANKVEASSEAKAEAAKLHRVADGSASPVQVRGQALQVGQVLHQALDGRDPALAKRDADDANAAAIPPAVRARLAELRRSTPIPPTDKPTA